MPSRQSTRHPGDLRLLAIATGRRDEAEASGHVATCDACRGRLEKLRLTAEVVRDLDDPLPAPAVKRPPALELIEQGEGIGRALVEAAELGPPRSLAALNGEEPSTSHGLLYACQLGMALGPRAPQKAIDLARFVARAAWGQPLGSPIHPGQIRAEAALLESQGLLFLGHAEEAAELAGVAARDLRSLRAAAFAVARADYYLGSALAMLMRPEGALDALLPARQAFLDAHQDSWVGRAESAIGLALDRSSNDPAALDWYASALSRLDPQADGTTIAATLQNRATLLLSLGRFAEAREGYTRCLAAAMRHRAITVALDARVNLIAFLLEDREFDAARDRAERLLAQARAEGRVLPMRDAQLALAEAHAGLGNYGAARALVAELAAGPSEELGLGAGLDVADLELTAWLRRVRNLALGWPEARDAASGFAS